MSIEFASNQQVELSGTCKVEDMVLHSLSPKYRSLNIIVSSIIGSVIVMIIVFLAIQPLFSMPQKFLDYYYIGVTIIIIFTLWSVLYSYLADPKKKYSVREFESLRHRHFIVAHVIREVLLYRGLG